MPGDIQRHINTYAHSIHGFIFIIKLINLIYKFLKNFPVSSMSYWFDNYKAYLFSWIGIHSPVNYYEADISYVYDSSSFISI